MRKAVTIIPMAALAALAAGCGTTTVTQSPEPAHSPGTTPASPSPPTGSQAGQVGDKFTVTSGQAKYDVTLLNVDQQARPESDYLTAQSGHHLAAAQFRVTAVTSTDENSNLSATVTGSDDQAYTSSLLPVAAGTNFASGQIRLEPGSSLVGWVSFQLPTGVRVTKVQWTPQAGISAHRAEWHVNSSAATSPGATPAPTSTPGGTAPGQTTNPEDTVNAYFDAINSGDYQKAWNLGGKNTTSSYSSFVSGFKNTEMVSVQILDVSGDIATATVTARLNTLEKDGSTKVFEGTYTVKNGVITAFNVHQVS
jgi:hypothetical protein